MKLIYVAGPFRADNAWDIEQNIRRAEECALGLWRMGAAVICPHTNTRFFHGAADDSIWLNGDLEILRRCDAVYMVLRWERSSGARAEKEEAEKHGLKVFEDTLQVAEWLST